MGGQLHGEPGARAEVPGPIFRAARGTPASEPVGREGAAPSGSPDSHPICSGPALARARWRAAQVPEHPEPAQPGRWGGHAPDPVGYRG